MLLQPWWMAVALLSFLSTVARAAPARDSNIQARSGSRYVFAHFVVGTVGDRTGASDWDADFIRAKAYGIDALALDIGTNQYEQDQLVYAYKSAANNGMKAFISFDFNYWQTNQVSAIATIVNNFTSNPAQLFVDSKVFVSTFAGVGLDVVSLRSQVSQAMYFAPNFDPAAGADLSHVDASFNWMGWPNNGQNRAPNPGQINTVENGDQAFINALNGKDYMAPASPWFFTHYGPTSYAKNWLFPSEGYWLQRWGELLTKGPRFIEIVTWNDFGESHYVGPLSQKHYDDGASTWCNDMPHDAWLDIAMPFIAAYKAGSTSVNSYITSDLVVYWYRPQSMNQNCDATDTCMSGTASGNYYVGKPNGWQTVSDSIFVASLLTSPGTIQINSGGNVQSNNVAAGPTLSTFNMSVGQQEFSLLRSGSVVLNGLSLKNIISGCVCGLYNFNAYVGSLTASGLPPSLSGDGYDLFSSSLRVSTCAATPSLSSQSATLPPPSTSASATTTSTISRRPLSKGTVSGSTTGPTTSMTTGATTPAATTTAAGAAASTVCIGGIGANNYGGLCAFDCQYGYCPPGSCTCTASGSPSPTPSEVGWTCTPAAGLDDSYKGLCNFACDHGYQPTAACARTN